MDRAGYAGRNQYYGNAYYTSLGICAGEIVSQPGLLKVMVADNSGIPSEDLPVYLKGFTGKRIVPDYGGNTYRLSIARKIVEAHGGKIGVESIVGEGTHLVYLSSINRVGMHFETETDHFYIGIAGLSSLL